MAGWKKRGFNPEKIAEKLDKITFIEPSTNQFNVEFGYPDYSYSGLLAVLASMVELSSEIPKIEHLAVLSKAIKAAKLKGTITERTLRNEISIQENHYRNQLKTNYVLVTHISADSWFTKPILANRKIKDATITFTRRLPKNFRSERKEVEEEAKWIILREFPDRYQVARVNVLARSVSDAVEVALDRLDLIRAIWNFSVNRNNALHPRVSGGIPQPINQLVLGPLHTLHKPDGKRATDITQWWYEPNYIAPVYAFDLKKYGEIVYKSERNIRKCLANMTLCYRTELEAALIRYVRALDETHWHNTLLGLWGILEYLTHSGGSNYDTTIKRVVFLYDEAEYHRQILNHLKEQRNEFVHAGTLPAFSETLAYQIKYYVDQLFEFHLFNDLKFSSLAESAIFLDYPSLPENLISSMNMLKKVIKFRKIG